jgi:hypothetical protein
VLILCRNAASPRGLVSACMHIATHLHTQLAHKTQKNLKHAYSQGDQLVAVDGRSVFGLDMQEICRHLVFFFRGKQNRILSSVSLSSTLQSLDCYAQSLDSLPITLIFDLLLSPAERDPLSR